MKAVELADHLLGIPAYERAWRLTYMEEHPEGNVVPSPMRIDRARRAERLAYLNVCLRGGIYTTSILIAGILMIVNTPVT
jgi:hypothetical protein